MAGKRKPKIFVAKHKKTKGQQREFDRLSVPLRHLPENLSRITITCPSCRTVFRPDWFKKQELPMTPVKPKFDRKGVEYKGPKRWILRKVPQKCPKCGADVMIPLPVNKMRTKGSLFGDDAERNYQNKKVSMYSLIGTDQSLLSIVENKIKGLKQKLFPSVPPNSWKIHMKDMWAGSSRKKHPVYKTLRRNDVISFVRELLMLIKESNLFIYNIASTTVQKNKGNRKVQKELRNEAYILLVLNAIEEWTAKNAQPNIFFDSEKNSQANVIIHGWARDTFKGSQYSLLYGFLSKGIEIPEPKFVPSASSPGLEVADFVSFTIARYYLRMWQGRRIEIDPKDMGLVTYLGYDSNGDLLWKRQEGYPWDQFVH
jgi:hypothetical protein